MVSHRGERKVAELRRQFETHGQGHVFRFWDELDAEARARLVTQAAALELPALLASYRATQDQRRRAPKLEAVPVEALPEHGGDPARIERARERGEALLAAGRVALMVVAGGQATRLGFSGPKGFLPIGPVTQRTLFALQAQKLLRLRSRCGRPVPWYVMTSPATDAATREGFARAAYFGLPAEDVFFLSQAMVPSFDFEGRIILERPDRIFESPNGHGGALPALLGAGALDDMERRGIDTIFYHQVDNPLARLGDAAFLGFHAESAAEMSCKVIRKLDAAEKLGVVARIDGRVGVIEYTEIDDEQRHARDDAGELQFWAGNLALHVFDTAFVRRVAEEPDAWLPYHASAKKIPCVDAQGRTVAPEEPNGQKLERFVFDALAAARSVCVVEARRADEYSPVKNADGRDSPATARRDLVSCYRAWIEATGLPVPAEATAIEIDESRVSGPEDLRSLGIRSLDEPGSPIRTAAGDQG